MQQTQTSMEGTSVPTAGGLRSDLHAGWSSVAWAWGANAAFVDQRGAHVTERMLALTAPQPGERVLELGCGTGGPGLDAAPLVEPGGDVVVSDVAIEMTSIAAARASALGLDNVSARVLDLERIDAPDASYDVVLCREALMLVEDPVQAMREVHRVLRPGGRVAVTVWGSRLQNPWLGVVFHVVGEQLGGSPVKPGTPHPFSLDAAGRLAGVFTAAGLDDVEVSELSTPYHAGSPEEWWDRTSVLAGPLAQLLARLPDDAGRGLRQRALDAVEAYRTDDGIEMPGVSLVASASR